MSTILKINTLKLENKRVFVRADLNIPVNNRTILSDFKLQKILPTLDFLIQKNCKIILATHIDRPQNCEQEDSTHLLISWFVQKKYTIFFEPDLARAKALSHEIPGGAILL